MALYDVWCAGGVRMFDGVVDGMMMFDGLVWCLVEILKKMLDRDFEDEVWSRFMFEL